MCAQMPDTVSANELHRGLETAAHSKIHYLVEAEEAEVTDHAECADSRSSGDLACHLQANLHNLQGVGKDHLRASSLNKSKEEACSHTHKKKKRKRNHCSCISHVRS